MKIKVLTTVILLSAMELFQLAAARPSLSQNDLNAQLQEALCAQDWGRALQVIDQMKKAAGRAYASQLTLYRGRIEVLARENAKVPEWAQQCANGNGATSSGGNSPSPQIQSPNPSINPPGTIPEAPANSPTPTPDTNQEAPAPNSPTPTPDTNQEAPAPNSPTTPPVPGNNIQY